MNKSTFDKSHYAMIYNRNEFLRQVIENDFSFTHELCGTKDESSKFVTDHVRFFRDMTTEAFVNIFLSDKQTRFRFIDYTYHTINSALQTKINEYLCANHQVPLNGDEGLYFVFKGGNVMNFFVEAMVDGGIEQLFDTVRLDSVDWLEEYGIDNIDLTKTDDAGNPIVTFKQLITFIKTKFKISDIDYSIVISGANYARYTLIYGGVVKILADALRNVANIFNMMFETRPDDGKIEITKDVPHTAIKEIDENYRELKNMLSHPYIAQYIESVLKEKPYEEKSVPISAQIIEYVHLLITLDPLDKVTVEDQINLESIITIIQYLQTIGYLKHLGLFKPMVREKFSATLAIMQNMLNDKLRLKQLAVQETNFYSPVKIEGFITDLANRLNKEFDKSAGSIKKYEMYFTGLEMIEDSYEMTKRVEAINVDISDRRDMIVCSSNNTLMQIKNKECEDSGRHYVTFNNIIYIRQPVSVCFDLMRIKFNTTCNEVFTKNKVAQRLSIPSEFIDVSIPRYQDTSLGMFLKHDKVYDMRYTDETTDVSLVSYDLEEICSDLQYVLFEQNYYCPWLDRKYEKRLFRLMFMLACCAHDEDLEHDSAPDNDVMDHDQQVEYIDEYSGKLLRVVQFIDKILTYATSDDKTIDEFPIDDAKDFLVFDPSLTPLHEIKNIIPKSAHLHIYQLICIKPEYQFYEMIIKSAIIFSLMNKTTVDIAFTFINKNRTHYNYIPHQDSDKNTVVKEYIKLYIAMLKVIVDIGIKSYHIFRTLRVITRYAKLPKIAVPVDVSDLQNPLEGGAGRQNAMGQIIDHRSNYQKIYESNRISYQNLLMLN